MKSNLIGALFALLILTGCAGLEEGRVIHGKNTGYKFNEYQCLVLASVTAPQINLLKKYGVTLDKILIEAEKEFQETPKEERAKLKDIEQMFLWYMEQIYNATDDGESVVKDCFTKATALIQRQKEREVKI